MKLLNYTNRALLFVHKDNLTPRGNGRFEIDSEKDLDENQYLPISGPALRVHLHTEMTHLSFGLPIVSERILGVDPLPEGDDILIVSKQYAEACRRLCMPTHRLRVVCGGVYTPGVAYPIASTGLAYVEACLPYDMPELFKTGESDLEGATDYVRKKRLEEGVVVVPTPEPVVDVFIQQIDAGLLELVIEPAPALVVIHTPPADYVPPVSAPTPKNETVTLRALIKKLFR